MPYTPGAANFDFDSSLVPYTPPPGGNADLELNPGPPTRYILPAGWVTSALGQLGVKWRQYIVPAGLVPTMALGTARLSSNAFIIDFNFNRGYTPPSSPLQFIFGYVEGTVLPVGIQPVTQFGTAIVARGTRLYNVTAGQSSAVGTPALGRNSARAFMQGWESSVFGAMAISGSTIFPLSIITTNIFGNARIGNSLQVIDDVTVGQSSTPPGASADFKLVTGSVLPRGWDSLELGDTRVSNKRQYIIQNKLLKLPATPLSFQQVRNAKFGVPGFCNQVIGFPKIQNFRKDVYPRSWSSSVVHGETRGPTNGSKRPGVSFSFQTIQALTIGATQFGTPSVSHV